MRKVSEKKRQQIVDGVVKRFRCFGEGAEGDTSNPVHQWTANGPPIFALGVDVREVIDYVIARMTTTPEGD